QPQPFGDREVPGGAVVEDLLTLDVLHDEVGEAVVGGAPVQEPGDVGMVEAGQDLALALEVAYDLRGVGSAAKDLEGDPLVELLVGPQRQVDGAHAPVAQLADQPVGPDAALESRGGSGRRPGPGRLGIGVRESRGTLFLAGHGTSGV